MYIVSAIYFHCPDVNIWDFQGYTIVVMEKVLDSVIQPPTLQVKPRGRTVERSQPHAEKTLWRHTNQKSRAKEQL